MSEMKRAKSRPEFKELLAEERLNFINLMSREPDEYDPIVISKYFYSLNEFKRMTILNMLQAGIPENLIYIFDKTGFILDKKGFKLLPKDDRLEVEKAQADFDNLDIEGPYYTIEKYDDGHINEHDPLPRATYIIGNFIDRNINNFVGAISTQRFICGYLIVRFYRILRAIIRMHGFSTNDEIIILIRSLYEIYCKIVYATSSKENAEYLVEADLGLVIGTHEVAIINGKPSRKLLINKRTGVKIPRNRSFFEYISVSPFDEDVRLFKCLYIYLSSFAHSGSRHIPTTWSAQQSIFLLIDETDHERDVFPMISAAVICAMTMQAMLRLSKISTTSRFDMRIYRSACKKILNDVQIDPNNDLCEIVTQIKERAVKLDRLMPRTRVKKL